MGKPGNQRRGHAVADASGIVVEQDRRLGDGLGHGHRRRAVSDRHFRKTHALFCVDGADAEIDRDSARRLGDCDLQSALHLVLFDLIKLPVGAEDQDAVHTAVDHIVDLTAKGRLVDTLVCVNGGQNRDDYALDEIRIHSHTLSGRSGCRSGIRSTGQWRCDPSRRPHGCASTGGSPARRPSWERARQQRGHSQARYSNP